MQSIDGQQGNLESQVSLPNRDTSLRRTITFLSHIQVVDYDLRAPQWSTGSGIQGDGQHHGRHATGGCERDWNYPNDPYRPRQVQLAAVECRASLQDHGRGNGMSAKIMLAALSNLLWGGRCQMNDNAPIQVALPTVWKLFAWAVPIIFFGLFCVAIPLFHHVPMTWIYGGLVGGALLTCVCAVGVMDSARRHKAGSKERDDIVRNYLLGLFFFSILVGGMMLKFSWEGQANRTD
jgi:hypothetical protein